MEEGQPTSVRGHAQRPHTADLQVEAWAQTPAACYEEAVAALVAAFADASGVTARHERPFDVGPGDPDDLLVLLLEEVLVIAETEGVLPVDTHVAVAGDRLVGSFSVAAVGDIEVSGSIPKGISYHELCFEADHGRWHCRATVDV